MTEIRYGGPGTRKCCDCGITSSTPGTWIGMRNETQKWACKGCAEDLLSLQPCQTHNWEQIPEGEPENPPEDSMDRCATRPWSEEDERMWQKAVKPPRDVSVDSAGREHHE